MIKKSALVMCLLLLFADNANANTPEIKNLVAEALNQRALVLMNQGNIADAELLLNESLVVSPNSPSANIARQKLEELHPKPVAPTVHKTPRLRPQLANGANKSVVTRSPIDPYKTKVIKEKQSRQTVPPRSIQQKRRAPMDPYSGTSRKRIPQNPYN